MTRTTHRGVCNVCEAICGLRIEVEDGRVVSIRGDEDDPLSRGHLCPKGVALQDLQADRDRLRRPVRRRDGRWEELGWDEAFELVATRLAEIRDEHGPDAVAVYLGNPVVHSLGAMTHGVPFVRMLGTRNRFSATSVDQLPHQLVAYEMYGHQWLLPVPDLERTQHLLVVGANPMASNGSLMTAPGFPHHHRRLRERGGRMVVVDPRRTETAEVADEHHFVRPGTDAALLLAMVHSILADGLAAPVPFLDGLAAVAEAVEPYTPEAAAVTTGIEATVIRDLASTFARAPSAAAYGRIGVSTQRHGVLSQWAIQLLNAITGNLDRPGGTMLAAPAVDPVRAGTVDAGSLGAWRSRVRGAPEFGGELPVAVLAEEIETPGRGQVRALVTIAGNPVASTPAGHRLADALGKLDFQVAVDLYVNETTSRADVILPPTTILEREHYDLVYHQLAVRNTARFVDPVLPTPDDARHDWQILAQLARRYRRHVRAGRLMDRLALRLRPTQVVDLALRTGPYRLSVAKLRRHPSGVDLGPLRPSLPRRLKTEGKVVRAAPPRFVDAAAAAVGELLTPPGSDALLLIGRRHQRDNNSWMHNLPRLTRGQPRHHLLMHPDDAVHRGIVDGSAVWVRSEVGEVVTDVRVTAEVMRGVVSLPHGYGHRRDGVLLRNATDLPGASVNDLTDPAVLDPVGGTAVLNGVPVEVGPLDGVADDDATGGHRAVVGDEHAVARRFGS